MTLNKLGTNQTEITFGKDNHVLFSYNTPVAAYFNGVFYRTSKKWSNTTSKHINKWLAGANGVVEIKPQEFFTSLTQYMG